MKQSTHSRRFIVWVLLVGASLLPASAVQAATLHVGASDTYKTIQSGIDAAVDGDTVIVRDGTYSPPDANGIDFRGKAITLRSENGPVSCIIDGDEWSRGFNFHSYENAESKIDGFTIRNCYSLYANGGGIYCTNSSPTITNCILSGNGAKRDGGGIYCSASSPTITNCTLSGNSAVLGGGGFYCDNFSFPTITNCTFSGNSAGSSGGGMLCGDYSTPKIINCILSGNSATYGGGIYCYSTNPTITNCILSGNEAYQGSGFYCYFSSPYVTNCILSGNTASSGGVIQCEYYSEPAVTYSNIQGGYAGAGNIDLDPGFVNASAGDFHLKSGSPCIDKGINSAKSIQQKDKDGANRIVDGNGDGTATVDMGAYEYQGTGTGVRLASFKATPGVDGMVKITWRTATETDNAGFHLWRSHLENGKYTRLTEEIIPSKGTAFEGARYRFHDLATRHGKTYFYKLEDVDFEGKSTFHGPVKAVVK